MQRPSLGWGLLGVLGLTAAIGCAVGTDPGDVSQSELLTLPAEAGDENSVILRPSTPPSPDSGAASGDDASTTADAGTQPDAGADAGGGGGGGTVSCASPNTCAAAVDLGAVSGDTGADTQSAQGTGSQWFKIRVTEDDSGVFAWPLNLRADLSAPSGANFDVYLYVASNVGNQECSAVSASSTNPTTFDTANVEFGESGTFSNGSQDDRTVTVEVRWVSGTCAPGAKWSLTVRGNSP
jgi:hypothetical protein